MMWHHGDTSNWCTTECVLIKSIYWLRELRETIPRNSQAVSPGCVRKTSKQRREGKRMTPKAVALWGNNERLNGVWIQKQVERTHQGDVTESMQARYAPPKLPPMSSVDVDSSQTGVPMSIPTQTQRQPVTSIQKGPRGWINPGPFSWQLTWQLSDWPFWHS